MTYLTPDDWYANHGMAPGDAKLPQGILQPRPGNMAATPPMRGTFGRRAPVPSLAPSRGGTVSPWAVSDVMWGNSPPPPGVGGYALGAEPVQLVPPKPLVTAQPVYVVHRPGHEARQVGTKVVADLIAAGVLSSLGTVLAYPIPHAPRTQSIRQVPRTVTIPPFASRSMVARLQGLGYCGPPRQLGGPLGDGSADATATIAAMQKKVKTEILAVTATNLAISIGLECIPVVGWGLGLLYGLITGITEAKYQRAAQKVLADMKVALLQYGAQLQAQLADLQSQVFDANKAAGIALATSTQPLPSNINISTCATTPPSASSSVVTPPPPAAAPVNGLGRIQGLGSVFSSINTQVQRATAAVDQAARKTGTAVANVAKAITGKDILDRARAAADTASAQVKAELLAQYNTSAANLNSPAYAQELVLVIACRIRQDPSISQMLLQTTSLEEASGADSSQVQAQLQSLGAGGIPQTAILTSAAAAGAVLLVGFLGSR